MRSWYRARCVQGRRLDFRQRPQTFVCGRIFLSLGRALSGVITVLEDRGYMITGREKMNNIKKVAKFYNYDFLSPTINRN